MLVTTLRRVVVTNCSPGATPGRTAALRARCTAGRRARGPRAPSFFGCGVRTRVGGTAEHFGTRGAAARGGRARGPAGSAALAFAERDPRGGCHGAAYDAARPFTPNAQETAAQVAKRYRGTPRRRTQSGISRGGVWGSRERHRVARGNGNKGPGYGVGDIVFTRRYEG